MQVLIENGYVSSYALIGSIVGGVEVPNPPDLDHSEDNFQAYRLSKGRLVFDEARNTQNERQALCERLRQQRETECFSVVNRGRLWYNALSDEQLGELQTWYESWLDITDTLTVPARPSWL